MHANYTPHQVDVNAQTAILIHVAIPYSLSAMTTPIFLSKRISSAPNTEFLRARFLLAMSASANTHGVAEMYTQSSFTRDLACLS